MGALEKHKVVAIEHADDLTSFLKTVNTGPGASYMLVDRAQNARIADELAQYVPVLGAFVIAEFSYSRIEFLSGFGRGNGRSASGKFTPNVRFSHVNPFTVESLEDAIEAYYQLRLSTFHPASAAQ
jgi:hypothetical protein